ncbi:hypothetical protein FHS89_001639 [Rubricella aquisinus]|uniref:Uncharacterized protein n=1 Tax=Rubricella aquisinus TaxID=2028108 RepID=A0A840X4M1_9RHOB|nr:hypothetical protein [Rubricella aquisinus]
MKIDHAQALEAAAFRGADAGDPALLIPCGSVPGAPVSRLWERTGPTPSRWDAIPISWRRWRT